MQKADVIGFYGQNGSGKTAAVEPFNLLKILLSANHDAALPLRSESGGTLKIISILSTLIAVYNNPNACVVIDELDAGIFEYLLDEILEVLNENAQGQLFFTSHNLRAVQLGGQEEAIYAETNLYDIKTAFRKAGISHGNE